VLVLRPVLSESQAPPAATAKQPDRPAAKTVDTQSAVPAADATAAEVATPTSPAALEADQPAANESDGATVTDEGEGGGAVAANGDVAEAGGGEGGVTSREQRPRPPRPGWPTHLPWPLPDPPPSRITLPGPHGPVVYILATHNQVRAVIPMRVNDLKHSGCISDYLRGLQRPLEKCLEPSVWFAPAGALAPKHQAHIFALQHPSPQTRSHAVAEICRGYARGMLRLQ